MNRFEVADNIDLLYILQQFSEYFEMKFDKRPIVVKQKQEESGLKQTNSRRNRGSKKQLKGF